MFQRVNIDIETDERVNMRFVNESISSIKKKEHLNDLFACPFFIDGCEDDVTIGWITSSAVKELLSYFSLTVVEHNEFLLNQSHYIDTYEDLFVNEFGLKIYLSKDNSTKELTVNKTHTPSCRYYLVSSWSVIEDNLNHKYLDEFTSQVQEVYGNTDGFGSRSVSKSFGLNVYSGY